MQASVIIPVWNGESVISACLDALYAHSGEALLEVICVDNASLDQSATQIAGAYPQVQLFCQPVNLGFAGGVNVGLQAAQGDLLILLNQDCVVQPGWLVALVQAFANHPRLGIAGCTILNADGTVNHAGARLQRPAAYSEHLTTIAGVEPQSVEYVTGAAFAIRQQAWQAVGKFDEDFYPAYYEESDYCFRARNKGFEIAHVPEARVKHLFSSREWQSDPVKHTANQHRARYRFVGKHFRDGEMSAFFTAELADIEAERYFDQEIGRVIAARDTLRDLRRILQSRRRDLENLPLSATYERHLMVGFTQILRQSLATAQTMYPSRTATLPGDLAEAWQAARQRLDSLQQQEYALLTRIYFRAPSEQRLESTARRLLRLLVLRPLSFLIGRDYLLLSQLNTIHVARMDQLSKMQRLLEQQIDCRLSLLETLVDYDYR